MLEKQPKPEKQNSKQSNTIHELRCPLCGESNNCAYAAGKPHSECWCNNAVFPEEVFERIPAEHRRKSCICQQCLENEVGQ
ncbi:MAG: cysteine-rich CWC family protein [Paenibacillus sp.]|uniref:cysteine-rich CWC family protein n=1 Tax=Paenibacillus sp. TaxID=58172 RepID=UPI0025E173B8|nr:cysteine-rich CWC family protein [Paenibacillus sp.]MBR2564122.1 cysteine-rich CWC family protein [Paenibacillus sp.]